jgi:hypothetical protein
MTTICLRADTLDYPQGGGHFWAYMNWALGLRANGCRVIWLEHVDPALPAHTVRPLVASTRAWLSRYGFADALALCSTNGVALPAWTRDEALTLEDARVADLLLDMSYGTHADIVAAFRRSALMDIDPGLLQQWLVSGTLQIPRHTINITMGETVGTRGRRLPDAGLEWHYTPPCAALEAWPASPPGAEAAFTTVSHWFEDGWVEGDEGFYRNDKRTAFLPFLELPRRSAAPLELALCLGEDEREDRDLLEAHGWRVRHSYEVSGTPWDYQAYVQGSLGEFSCAKPAYVRLETAWFSDRSVCYLASGKPVTVQFTGTSRFLPDRAGVFRFKDLDEAARCLAIVQGDYDGQCALARALAEEHFDARKVTRSVLERALC